MGRSKRKAILSLLLIGIMLATAVPAFAAKGNEKQWARGSSIGDIIRNGFSKVGKFLKDIVKRIKNPGKNPGNDPVEEPAVGQVVIAEFKGTSLDNFGKVSIKSLEGVEDASYYSVSFKYSDGKSEDVVGPVAIEEDTTEIFYNSESPVTIEVYGENLDTPLHVFEDVYLELSE